MNISVATFYDGNYSELGGYTSLNKKKYCDKHGYSFINRKESYLKYNRPSSWAKLSVIVEEFKKNVDWVLWTDADSVFTNFETKIESYIDNNFHLIFAVEGLYESICFWPSGCVFLAKNSPETIKFLKYVWNQPPEIINHCWWEQLGIIKTINENPDIRSYYKILPHNTLYSQKERWQKKDFIFHVAGGQKDGKLNVIRENEYKWKEIYAD